MRSSIIRTGLAALAAAVALAACGGRGMVPSQSVAPGGTFTQNVIERAASPCAAKTLPWYFHGSCVSATLTSKGNTVTLKPYLGVGFLIKIGSNTSKGTIKFIVGDAKGGKDITGKTKFPLYSSKKCAKGFKCPGKSLIYIEAANNSKATISLTGGATLTVTSKTFPGTGKGCFPAVLTTGGWNTQGALLITKPKSGKVTIVIPPGLFSLAAGAEYIDMVCE